MQKLSQLIEATRSSTQEFRNSKPVEIEDVPWETAKKEVDQLSQDYGSVMSNHREYANKKDSGKYVRLQANLPSIQGFKCQLVVYEPLKDADVKAFYVLFNTEKSVVYKRDLL